MVNDGILPSNEGRGYVLRRLLRQAVRAGKTLGISDPFVYKLSGTVVDLMKDAYPETMQRRETIASVVKSEEEKFLETLDVGTRRLEELITTAKSQKVKTLSGKDVFQLYDTFGFPFELTKEMVDGMGFHVDEAGYKKAQAQAVELARQNWKGSGAQDVDRYHEWKIQTESDWLFLSRLLASGYRRDSLEPDLSQESRRIGGGAQSRRRGRRSDFGSDDLLSGRRRTGRRCGEIGIRSHVSRCSTRKRPLKA